MRKTFLTSGALSMLAAIAILARPAVAASLAPDPLADFAAMHAKLVQMESAQMAAAGDDAKRMALLARLIAADSRAASAVLSYEAKAAKGGR